MLTRHADDVWAELYARCDRLQQSGTPVLTMVRKVPDLIVGVDEQAIYVKSEAARTNNQSARVARGQVAAIWEDLTAKDRTTSTADPQIAYSLVGTLIDGIGYKSDPFRLEVTDSGRANQGWRDPAVGTSELVELRHWFLNGLADLRVYRSGELAAPHKPLLLLLVLAEYVKGTAGRFVHFADVETPLTALIRRYSETGTGADASQPFWRLKTSDFWNLNAAGSVDLTSPVPPPVRELREYEVHGGFEPRLDRASWRDDTLALDAVHALLAAHFRADQRVVLLDALGLSAAVTKEEERSMETTEAENALGAALRRTLEVLAGTREEGTFASSLREPVERGAPTALRELLSETHPVKGSAGMGNLAEYPWVAVFPPGAGTRATMGIYLVYLFAADGSRVYLSLNQAATQLEGGVKALLKRALDVRTAIGPQDSLDTSIDLAGTGHLGKAYAAGSAYAISYTAQQLADGAPLAADLHRMLGLLQRALDLGLEFDPKVEPLHLLLKWSAARGKDTLERHRDAAEKHGSVWWGKFSTSGSAGISGSKLAVLQGQLAVGTPTHAYLHHQSEVWRTRLEEITTDASQVDEERMAGYYDKDTSTLFARLSDFQEVEFAEFAASVVLASNPDPEALKGALGNQTNPLFLYERWTPPTPIVEPPTVLTLNWLADQTLWPRERLEDVLHSLTDASPQVILAGPPGTGKTWVAQLLARYLTDDGPLQHRTVQFHPSYGYEEFVEGLRPEVTESSALAFHRVDGTVLQMSETAKASEDPHVLIIDEMNRANIPRVFGELMYLLEYRDQPINLMYTENFELPGNLHFIGTMNTADRSIRSIDVALRRRFDIFDCPPDPDILRRFYEHVTSVDGLIDGFTELNGNLTAAIDRHHTIGHTFFMAPKFDAAALSRTWHHQLAPLIEDYFFDQPDVAASYTLDKFWPSVAQ